MKLSDSIIYYPEGAGSASFYRIGSEMQVTVFFKKDLPEHNIAVEYFMPKGYEIDPARAHSITETTVRLGPRCITGRVPILGWL